MIRPSGMMSNLRGVKGPEDPNPRSTATGLVNLKEVHSDLGLEIADALFLGWMNAFDQERVHSIIEHQLLVLDDDDGDLTNGTPNIVPIRNAFLAHGFEVFVPGQKITIRICQ